MPPQVDTFVPQQEGDEQQQQPQPQSALERRVDELLSMVEELRRQVSDMQSEMQRQAARHERERSQWEEERQRILSKRRQRRTSDQTTHTITASGSGSECDTECQDQTTDDIDPLSQQISSRYEKLITEGERHFSQQLPCEAGPTRVVGETSESDLECCEECEKLSEKPTRPAKNPAADVEPTDEKSQDNLREQVTSSKLKLKTQVQIIREAVEAVHEKLRLCEDDEEARRIRSNYEEMMSEMTAAFAEMSSTYVTATLNCYDSSTPLSPRELVVGSFRARWERTEIVHDYLGAKAKLFHAIGRTTQGGSLNEPPGTNSSPAQPQSEIQRQVEEFSAAVEELDRRMSSMQSCEIQRQEASRKRERPAWEEDRRSATSHLKQHRTISREQQSDSNASDSIEDHITSPTNSESDFERRSQTTDDELNGRMREMELDQRLVEMLWRQNAISPFDDSSESGNSSKEGNDSKEKPISQTTHQAENSTTSSEPTNQTLKSHQSSQQRETATMDRQKQKQASYLAIQEAIRGCKIEEERRQMRLDYENAMELGNGNAVTQWILERNYQTNVQFFESSSMSPGEEQPRAATAAQSYLNAKAKFYHDEADRPIRITIRGGIPYQQTTGQETSSSRSIENQCDLD